MGRQGVAQLLALSLGQGQLAADVVELLLNLREERGAHLVAPDLRRGLVAREARAGEHAPEAGHRAVVLGGGALVRGAAPGGGARAAPPAEDGLELVVVEVVEVVARGLRQRRALAIDEVRAGLREAADAGAGADGGHRGR